MNTIKEFAKRFNPQSIWIVGGANRDEIMGIKPVDFDLVCVGMDIDEFIQTIQDLPHKMVVGKEIAPGVFSDPPVFNVEITEGQTVEIAMARLEISTGNATHDFQYIPGKDITLMQDAVRRDFPSGAIYKNVQTGETFDPFNGRDDIQKGIIRPCSDKFPESPERLYRAASQIARFKWQATAELITVCKAMKEQAERIPAEQKWRHFEKMVKHGIDIQAGIDFMVEVGVIPAMVVPQSNDPVVIMASMVKQAGEDMMVMFNFPHDQRKIVTRIVDNPDCSHVRVLAVDIQPATIRQWAKVHGRNDVLFTATHIGVADKPEQNWITGDDLIAMGMKPGKDLGQMLKFIKKAQATRTVIDRDEAVEMAKVIMGDRWVM